MSMKTLKNGWYGLLVAALPFLVSGCLKSDNHVTFTISTGGYVLQKFEEGTPVYAPYIYSFSSQEIASAKLECTENPNCSYVKKAANVWETPLLYQSQIPNGTYEIWATNLEGEIATQKQTFTIDKSLGELNLKSFYFESGIIYAKWETVANATEYCLMFCVRTKEMASSGGFKRYNNYYVKWDPYNTVVTSGSYNLKEVVSRTTGYSLQDNDEVQIAVAVMYNRSGKGTLILESNRYVVTTKSGDIDFLQ